MPEETIRQDYIDEEVDGDRTYYRVYLNGYDVFYCSWRREAERVLAYLKDKREAGELSEGLRDLHDNWEKWRHMSEKDS